MSNGMKPGDRVAYVDNDFPSLGTVREASGGSYLVAWDDNHTSDWFGGHELAVIEKATEVQS
jgi:hypothetical protein